VSLAINLNEFLEGEPRHKLAHLIDNVDKDTYGTMWSCLDTFYGNEKEKARERFLKFESMPPVRVFSAGSISILITALESNWTLIKDYSNDKFLAEDNIHLYAFLKKIPLAEKDKFLDYCHFSSKRANFPIFKEWLTERWHRLKDASDSSKSDKALQFWQDDKPMGAEGFLQGAQETVEDYTVDWDIVQGEGFGYYQAPEAEDDQESGLYQYYNGKFQKIKRVQFRGQGAYRGQQRPRGSYQPWTGNKPQNPKSNQETRKAFPCVYCKKDGHHVYLCEGFKTLTLKDRYAVVKEHKLCLRCLSVGHIAKDCKLKFVCDIEKCGRRHHRLLHPVNMTKQMFQSFFSQGFESDLDSGDDVYSTKH